MPPGSAEFAVGDGLQTHLLLLLDDALDFAVLDVLERGVIDLTLGELGAGLFQRRWAQQRADVIGTKCVDWVAPEYRQTVEDAFETVFGSGQAVDYEVLSA